MIGASKIPQDYVVEFAAGTLSSPKRLMLACQKDICPQAASQIEHAEHIAASLLQDGPAVPFSEDFMARVLRVLPETFAQLDAPASKPANDLLPTPLQSFMDGQPVTWSFFAPGMKSMSLWKGRNGEQLWLLKVKGGVHMPEHTHIGEEWALILQGSYHVATEQYTRGDLHVEDEHCTHVPKIDPGVDCICLVMTEGPLKPTGLLPKLLMPFARI